MATQSRTTLKSYFNTGDKPTESQFVDLIDSGLHNTEDKATTAEITAGTNNVKFVTPAGAKASVLQFAPSATETVKGQIEIATLAEAQAGTDALRAVTPAGAKRSVETFAPVKTVNGVAPVSGNVNLETTDVGSVRFGIKKFYSTPSSSTNIFHIKLPYNIATNNDMFYLKAEGYAYGSMDIIDIVWVGYCYSTASVLKHTKTNVLRSTTITAGQYVGSDGFIYLWLKVPNTHYISFRLDTMRVGNGSLISGNDIVITASPNLTL